MHVPLGVEGESSMLRRALVTAVVLSTPLCLLAQQETRPSLKLVAPLAPLFESLRKANISGSLEFSSPRCDAGKPAEWPHWRILAASEKPPLQVARETWADDPTIQVTQDADGTMRMIQSGVPTDLLDLRISEIPRFDAYDANAAKESILWARDVAAFMYAHHIPMPSSGGVVHGGTHVDPPRRFDPMHDVTVSQAMDRVLKIFPGIWVYQDCLQPDGKGRFIWFTFLSSRGPGFYMEE